jgi:hypothetical protein
MSCRARQGLLLKLTVQEWKTMAVGKPWRGKPILFFPEKLPDPSER